MKIELTRDMKVALLEAVKSGSLDLSIFDKDQAGQAQNIEDVEREIVRLEKHEGNDYLLALSEMMGQFARGEITADEYTQQRINLIKSK